MKSIGKIWNLLKIKKTKKVLINSNNSRIKKQNLISFSIIIVGTLLSLLFFGFQKGNIFAQDQDKEKNQPEKEVTVIPIKILEVSPDTAGFSFLEKTVLFFSKNSDEVRADFSGRVEKVYFQVGDNVSSGQVLAILGGTEGIKSLEDSLKTAQNSFSIAQENLSNTKRLIDENLEIAKNTRKLTELQLESAEKNGNKEAIEIAKRNLKNARDIEDQAEESAKLQLNNAKLQLYQAENALNQAQLNLDKTLIKAPFSGTIVTQNIKEGDFINSGSVVAEIAGEKQLEAKVYLNWEQVTGVSRGQTVEIFSNDEKFLGKIDAIGKIASSENSRFEVKISSEELPFVLANQNLKVRIKINLSGEENSFFVPIEAVLIGQQKNEIFVFENGIARRKEVTIGKLVGERVEIISGVEKGDKVIIKNSQSLSDGDRVRIED